MELPENTSPKQGGNEATPDNNPRDQTKENGQAGTAAWKANIIDAAEALSGLVIGVLGFALSEAGFHCCALTCYLIALWLAFIVLEHRTKDMPFPGRKPLYWMLMLSTGFLFAFLLWHTYLLEHPLITKPAKWQPPELPKGCKTVHMLLGNGEGIELGVEGLTNAPIVNFILGRSSGKLDSNGHPILEGKSFEPKLYVKSNRLYVHLPLPLGASTNQVPIMMNDDLDTKLPADWDRNYNSNAYEIVDEQGLPLLQLIYKRPDIVRINGIFDASNCVLVLFGNVMSPDFFPAIPDRVPGRKPLFQYPSSLHFGELAPYEPPVALSAPQPVPQPIIAVEPMEFRQKHENVTLTIGNNNFFIYPGPIDMWRALGGASNDVGRMDLRVVNEQVIFDFRFGPIPGVPPLKLENNELSGLPSGWDFNRTSRAIEIVNEKSVPICQLFYKDDTHLVFKGVLVSTNRMIIAGETGHMLLIANPDLTSNDFFSAVERANLTPMFKYPSFKHPGQFATE
jgi:hypothetical protein